jgi:hypothetical protein
MKNILFKAIQFFSYSLIWNIVALEFDNLGMYIILGSDALDSAIFAGLGEIVGGYISFYISAGD